MKKKKVLVTLLCAAASLGMVATTVGCTDSGDNPPVVEDVKYTITFNSNGGSAVASLQVNKDGKITKPTDPTKAGFTFGGWFKEAACTTAWNFDTDTVTGDLDLYAKWTAVPATTFTVTFNSQGGSTVAAETVTQGGKATEPTAPTKEGFTFGGWYKEAACTTAWNFTTDTVTAATTLYAKWTVVPVITFVNNNDTANTVITATKDETDGKYYIDEPTTNPTKQYKVFDAWYTDEACTTKFNFSLAVTESLTLYANFVAAYDKVTTSLNFDAAAATIDPSLADKVYTPSNFVFGRFAIEAGAYFEPSGDDLNNQQKAISFELKGHGTSNGITISSKAASSGKDSVVTITNVDTNEVVKTYTDKSGGSYALQSISNLPAGNYKITSDGSIRIDALSISEDLEQGPTTEIELNTLSIQKNYLKGRAFSTAGLDVYLAYENGRKDLLDLSDTKLTISQPDMTTAGAKTITVTYQLNADTTYTKEFTINVCEIEEVVLYDYVLSDKRVTLHRQEIFALDSTFAATNLVVKAKCKIPGTTDEYIEFVLDEKEYTVSAPDMTTVGNKSVTVTFKGDVTKAETYGIEIITLPDVDGIDLITVHVNAANLVGAVEGEQYTFNFHTINHALQFLTLCQLDDNAIKEIYLENGVTYKEKVEINLPNVVLASKGAGSNEFTEEHYAVIEYDAIAGTLDPSEKVIHSTDGSATISIREDAVGFVAGFITFKNSYNTYEKYEESLKISKDSQAVACLVQADKAFFQKAKFTSYHDTLYAQVGRQYYDECYIEGHTDYIFGYNATAYFNECTITSIGAGVESNNGGYVVATKGNKEGASKDAIEYGYIFDNCTFTADENTKDGSVSLARGWDTSMAMMVMNSSIDGHFSKEAYGDTTSPLNDRYGKMNAEPVAAQLLEYSNTGDGAITESLENTCTVVDAAVAAPYSKLPTVFNHINGKMIYASNWAGPQETDVTVTLKDGANIVGVIEEWIGNTLIESQCSAPIKEGSAFLGWYTDAECTTEYDFDTPLSATELTLFAKYEEAEYDNKVLNISDVSSSAYEEDTLVGTFFTMTKKVKSEGIKQSNTSYTKNGENLTFAKQVSLTGGKAATNQNAIKFTVPEGKSALVTIYVSAKLNAKSLPKLSVLTDAGSDATVTNITKDGVAVAAFDTLLQTNNSVEKYTFELQAGTYYLGGTAGGAYVYGLTVGLF